MTDTPALLALGTTSLEYEVVRYGRVTSAEEAADLRGVPLAALIKTLVVRRGDGDYVFVLVPGDRSIDWAKLRGVLGVRRLSMPDAAEAKKATGYERGTITPFGATHEWPVIADTRVRDLAVASIGGGAHGVAVHVAGEALVTELGADLEDVTS